MTLALCRRSNAKRRDIHHSSQCPPHIHNLPKMTSYMPNLSMYHGLPIRCNIFTNNPYEVRITHVVFKLPMKKPSWHIASGLDQLRGLRPGDFGDNGIRTVVLDAILRGTVAANVNCSSVWCNVTAIGHNFTYLVKGIANWFARNVFSSSELITASVASSSWHASTAPCHDRLFVKSLPPYSLPSSRFSSR